MSTLSSPERASSGVPTMGGLIAAIGASACCFGPLALVTLGFSGAWIGRLQALAPYQPLFIALTVGSFGAAYHRLYIVPRRCTPDQACASPKVLRRQRGVFWVIAVLAAAMMSFPLYASWFY